jgi:hypothetical protein
VIDSTPYTTGLSGDLGWGDADEAAGPLTTAMLVMVTSTCWGLTWLLSGLAPLPVLASRVRALLPSRNSLPE